ncbi:hypothetical protein GUJ93_ZPchr0007g3143 [Zizania palustris]|uniref:Uncharacterized protein n=1 Tax=Zizania palustris TaxID=103762 RepID=A0A8J5W5G4_ZIZPA|nr:hypothetical protein GUJ93_ZPchr0007g3143 [Zizania palustris]KAG8081288.1 hypothetical protein GUJ93_ZPchr0007g3143 [Zizania palustris]
MPPPKELPGFYYDREKNRYFPIRGPIPGAATRLPLPPPPAEPPLPQAAEGCRKRARQAELLHAREIYGGGIIFSNNRKSTFMRQCQYAQASQPMVWKYKDTALVADRALQQLYAMIQTPNGLKESKLVVTGSMNGTVRLYGLGTAVTSFEDEMEFLPEPAWTPLLKQKASVNSALASMWSCETAFSNFSSSVTCIKKLEHHFPDAANTNSSIQRAFLVSLTSQNMVATLGSGESGGSIYIMDLSNTIDFAMGSLSAYRQNNIRIASIDRTIWTADCNSDGTQAVIGTNCGAALLNLETRAFLWLYHCKSDILSQQFVQSGNVVLCGLRNGSIVPVDIRQNHNNHRNELASPGTARRTVPLPPRRRNRWRTQAGNTKSSRAVSMSSAVCSLVALSSDEHYFLGSSMDGFVRANLPILYL